MAKNTTGELTQVQIEKVNGSCAAISAGVYTTIGCSKSATPPGHVREAVDGSCLEVENPSQEPGALQPQTMQFEYAWDPGDTESNDINTLINNKCQANWRLRNSKWTSMILFPGKVLSATPGQLQRGQIWIRTVTVAVTGDITYPAYA